MDLGFTWASLVSLVVSAALTLILFYVSSRRTKRAEKTSQKALEMSQSPAAFTWHLSADDSGHLVVSQSNQKDQAGVYVISGKLTGFQLGERTEGHEISYEFSREGLLSSDHQRDRVYLKEVEKFVRFGEVEQEALRQERQREAEEAARLKQRKAEEAARKDSSPYSNLFRSLSSPDISEILKNSISINDIPSPSTRALMRESGKLHFTGTIKARRTGKDVDYIVTFDSVLLGRFEYELDE